MDIKQILDAVHGPNAEGKKKTKFGLFHEIWGEDGSVEAVDELYISKPIINVSRLPGQDNDIYYCFEFVFRSNKDEDFKQMWRFLDRFANDSIQVEDEATKVPGLTLSIFPDEFNGEYFILAEIPLVDMIEKMELAGVKFASIRLYFEESCVQFLQNDEETFNAKALRDEILREMESESVEE